MLNSAASSLVIDGTSKREVIGQSLAAEYGVIEGKAESLKDQLQSIDADVYMRRPLNGKVLMAEEAAHENERASPVEASHHERKLSNSGTERNKRILPKTPKSFYSSTSQPVAKNNNQSADKQSRRTSDTKCLNPSGVSSSSGDMSPVSPETDETEDRFFNTKPKQTHIALYKFVARHDDETGLDPGDAVYVGKKCEDLWFEGVNLRTGKAGIFPSRYVSDILQDPSIQGEQTFEVFFFFMKRGVYLNTMRAEVSDR